jgi:hypothetical protein
MHPNNIDGAMPNAITKLRTPEERELARVQEVLGEVHTWLASHKVLSVADFYRSIPRMLKITDVDS